MNKKRKKTSNKKIIILFIIFILVLITLGFYYFYENHRVEEIDYQTFFNKWKNKDSFILVVSKTKCPYCQLYLPKVEDIAKKYKIKVYYVNTDNFTADESNSFSSYIDYQGSTPTTVFITNGEEKSKLSRIHGNVKYEKIIEKFKKAGYIK